VLLLIHRVPMSDGDDWRSKTMLTWQLELGYAQQASLDSAKLHQSEFTRRFPTMNHR